ncbi:MULTISPECIES: hypothetical protein [Nocardioides]|uniref:Uncharacterized protein n=1 Tax=Nocardioides lianchengensis TaxID=1045774 RepID=A0A1G6T097_9ACTN|nr:hypothetical protein [Nocardioides lianchengensis]NYG10021.1 peptidoglycan/LPS O-acetylase OafA/YrhL [Nocardioides lianchengensis]SDD21785.1 hypothetical protein SAMN05421872_106331 [Nocardioides lianchengensis]
MTTPAKTSDVTAPAAAAYEPVPVLAPFGWLLTLSAALLVVFSTWFIYGHDADGMWAGYRGGMVATAVVLATFALRTRMSPTPAIGVIGLGGALLILFALVYDDTTSIFVTELGGGVLILLGALLVAAGRRES